VAINQRGERGACSNEQKKNQKINESKKITKTITEKKEP